MTENQEVTCIHKDFIGIYHNVFTKEECQRVIDFFEDQDKYGITYTRKKHEGAHSLSKQDKSFCESELSYTNGQTFVRYGDISLWKPLLLKVIDAWKHYAEEVYPILTSLASVRINPAVKIQKTKVGEGYHIWHCEHGCIEDGHRLAAFTIYLNDVTEGGETEFLYQGMRVPATQGTLCFFPASYTHTHRGNPPYSNDKYIITSWMEFIQ